MHGSTSQGEPLLETQWCRCALGGALLLAAAMAGTVFVATAAVVGSVGAGVLAACTALLFAIVWLVLPLAMHGGALRGDPDFDDRPQNQPQTDQE